MPPLRLFLAAWLAFSPVAVGQSIGVSGPTATDRLNGRYGQTVDPLDQLAERIGQDSRLDAHELDELVAALAELDPSVAGWTASAGVSGLTVAEAPEWLLDPECPWPIANPLVLHATRAAVLGKRYESALDWLELRESNATRSSETSPLDGEAMALFYQAIAAHQLVRLDEAGKAAESLLALPSTAVARRHHHTARLILRDAKAADEESLGFVAKLMADSKRRLSLGRSGEPERELQQDIVDRLDRVIDELEEQQRKQQQQQQQAQGGPPSRGSTPMQQSLPGEMKGPGNVDARDIAKGGDWGSLPPAERERVTQQITRDFPGHYRSLIEQYFRSLADPEAGEPSTDAASLDRELRGGVDR